jgi:hypothetical protein
MEVFIHKVDTGRVRIEVPHLTPQHRSDLNQILQGIHTRQLLAEVLKNLAESWGIEATVEDVGEQRY